jgi:hypothetical protein
VCFLLAFFTKQTQLVAPMAAFVGLLAAREWRRALIVGMGFVLGAAALVSALQLGTAGEFFRHTVVYNANAFVPGQVEIWLNHLWKFGALKFTALLLLACGLALVARARPSAAGALPPLVAESPSALSVCAYWVGSALTIPTIGKAGAAGNYLLEFQAATALLAGLALARLLDAIDFAPLSTPRRRRLATALAASALALLLAHALQTARFAGSLAPPYYHRGPSQVQHALMSEIQIDVLDTDGPVLSEEPIFALRAGKGVLYQPFIMSQLAREGKWDQAPFVADLADGRFGLVVTTQDLRRDDIPLFGFTPEMRKALLSGYQLEKIVPTQGNAYYLWTPRAADPTGGEPPQRLRQRRRLVA